MGGGNDQLGGILRQFQQMQTPMQGRAQHTGMGQFGQFPSYYQPQPYQPAIFQPPQLAPVNQQLQQPVGGLFGNYNTNNGFMGDDDWRSPTTGGTGG